MQVKVIPIAAERDGVRPSCRKIGPHPRRPLRQKLKRVQRLQQQLFVEEDIDDVSVPGLVIEPRSEAQIKALGVAIPATLGDVLAMPADRPVTANALRSSGPGHATRPAPDSSSRPSIRSSSGSAMGGRSWVAQHDRAVDLLLEQ